MHAYNYLGGKYTVTTSKKTFIFLHWASIQQQKKNSKFFVMEMRNSVEPNWWKYTKTINEMVHSIKCNMFCDFPSTQKNDIFADLWSCLLRYFILRILLNQVKARHCCKLLFLRFIFVSINKFLYIFFCSFRFLMQQCNINYYIFR